MNPLAEPNAEPRSYAQTFQFRRIEPARSLVIAALGDIHYRAEAPWNPSDQNLATLAAADLVLISGDLTDTGLASEVRPLISRIKDATSAPVIVVLGNHDYARGNSEAIAGIVREAGFHVLDPGSVVLDLNGMRVGVAGTKGFWGSGWAGKRIDLHGEIELKYVKEGLAREVDCLVSELKSIETADYRIVLLHYSPTITTLGGEPEYILAFLGAAAMAVPIANSDVDLVVHGHVHRGKARGRIGAIPVCNAALPANLNMVSRVEILYRKRVDLSNSPILSGVRLESGSGITYDKAAL